MKIPPMRSNQGVGAAAVLQGAAAIERLALAFAEVVGEQSAGGGCAVAVWQDGKPLASETPVAEFLPKFAVAGKKRISLAELLSHRARLAAIDRKHGRIRPSRWAGLARVKAELARAVRPGA